MNFISTRNSDNVVSFEKAVRDCIPPDGGLYVPEDFEDKRRWVLYMNERTTFQSIAGALTSAFLKDEFSPIVCETMATRAFGFEPALKKLGDRLFSLELFNTPTGSHKDFGIFFLASCLETILTLKGEAAVFLDVAVGDLGASLARAVRGKKRVKAVLLYPRGMVRGLSEGDFVWNGGNVLPVEIDGGEEDCHAVVRAIFADRSLVEAFGLTVANTANIGRLIPQSFFYPYAFSRLKNQVAGDIFYALAPGNYSNLVAGLYSWKVYLPLNGFIIPTTDEIKLDSQGGCRIMDSIVPLAARERADPSSPSNIERLEDVFRANSLMLGNFVFPAGVSEAETVAACQELFAKYGVYADRNTSEAFAALSARRGLLDEASVVLVMRDHPALSADFIRHCLGESPEMPGFVSDALRRVEVGRPPVSGAGRVVELLSSL